ncbi:unnamed protein product, partial [Amoebophrya sp. A25]
HPVHDAKTTKAHPVHDPRSAWYKQKCSNLFQEGDQQNKPRFVVLMPFVRTKQPAEGLDDDNQESGDEDEHEAGGEKRKMVVFGAAAAGTKIKGKKAKKK